MVKERNNVGHKWIHILQVQHHHNHRRIIVLIVLVLIDVRIPIVTTNSIVLVVLLLAIRFVTNGPHMVGIRPTVPPPSVAGIGTGIEQSFLGRGQIVRRRIHRSMLMVQMVPQLMV